MKAMVIGHEAIAASAGSGKTFQLAHRYIRLLANGVKADRIIALTFSRKAAGEIFDSIVKYLCQAASSQEQARKVSERIERPDLHQEDFLVLLRELLDNLHRLHVGTLDSFTIGVVRAFAMELGIPASFQVLDSDSAAAENARKEVIGRIFLGSSVDRAARLDFAEAFRQATFGREEKRLQHSLDTFTSVYRGYYQVLPAATEWGTEGFLWPEGSLWLTPVGDVNAIAESLEQLLAQSELSEKMLARWHTFISAVRRFDAGSPWPEEAEYMFEKLAGDLDGLRRGKASIKIDRVRCDLASEQSRLALALMTHLMRTELITALERTRGIYRVLRKYENLYDEMLRLQGRLTFADAQYLLTEANSESGGVLISRVSGQEARLYIDYRLDCKLDHWLLDEFQDTNDVQWEVLRNLADEILQDTSGQRSFFYVGDVKQAIYGWRGGNARLFFKILEQYREQIMERRLHTSFRSCQPVIDTVNSVFGSLPEDGMPRAAVREWNRIWEHHQCEKGLVPEHGHAALLEPQCHNGKIKPTDEDRYHVVSSLLKGISPLSRGLSVAVLVRSNKNGKEIVDFLRRECSDMKVVHEGKGAIEDNPVVALLLSLVKFAAHPGDAFAWRHLEMSPLMKYLAEERLDRNSLSPELLREIQAYGFQTLLRNWGAQLDCAHPLDAFGHKRLKDLVNAAAEFDSSGSRDCSAFLRFIDSYQIHETAADDAVRVMTIHQSKGLGFDVVILPDLQWGGMGGGGKVDFVVARDPQTNRPRWALKMPRRIIAQNEPILAQQLEVLDENACFDSLCLLYVALTRAKRGLYMVSSFPGKTSKVLTPAAFLKRQLAGETNPVGGSCVTINGEDFTCLYEAGQRDWYRKVPEKREIAEAEEVRCLPVDFSKQPSHRRRLVRVRPSEQVEHALTASRLFGREYQEDLDFGKAMHGLMERISWIDEANVDALTQEWMAESLVEEKMKINIIEQLRRALSSVEVRQVLTQPDDHVELWREKRFEIVLGNQWVTGAFDRVTIVRDSKGKVVRATILDFKTDPIGDEADLVNVAEGYRAQMNLYQTALSKMLGLDSSKIALRLLFTEVARVHDLS